MFRFVMRETDDYDKLVEFMTPMGLEFGNDEAMGTQIVKCWEVIQEPDFLVGAVMLATRKGEYYINGIGVDLPMRRTGIGSIMMKKAITEDKARDGKRIDLCAKGPGFVDSLGFVRIPGDEA